MHFIKYCITKALEASYLIHGLRIRHNILHHLHHSWVLQNLTQEGSISATTKHTS